MAKIKLTFSLRGNAAAAAQPPPPPGHRRAVVWAVHGLQYLCSPSVGLQGWSAVARWPAERERCLLTFPDCLDQNLGASNLRGKRSRGYKPERASAVHRASGASWTSALELPPWSTLSQRRACPSRPRAPGEQASRGCTALPAWPPPPQRLPPPLLLIVFRPAASL